MSRFFTKAFLIAITTLFAHSSFCQVEFGVKGGMNLTTASFKTSDVEKLRLGFHAGVLLNIELSEKFILRPELLYSLKGWKYSYTIQPNNTTYNGAISLKYLSLPLLVGYKPVKNVCVLLGPEFGIQTGSNMNGWEKYDIGIDLGLAYSIHPKLGIEVRYNYGVTGIIKYEFTDSNGASLGTATDGYNRAFQVGLYYLLSKNK